MAPQQGPRIITMGLRLEFNPFNNGAPADDSRRPIVFSAAGNP